MHPVQSIAEALADPQVSARHGIVDVEHPVLGEVRHVASPFRISDFDAEVRRGPYLGEHTEAVLANLCGYSHHKVSALAACGVFGATMQNRTESSS